MKYLKLYEAFAKQTATQTRSASETSRGREKEQMATQTRSASETSREREEESDTTKERPNLYGTFQTDISSEIEKNGGRYNEPGSIDPPKCQPGWHFDKEKNKCVPDSIPTTPKKLDPKKLAYATLGDCPPGKIFNPKTNTCDDVPSVPSGDELSELHFIINKLLSILGNNYDGIKNAYIEIGVDSITIRNLYKELNTCAQLSMPDLILRRLKDKIKYFFNELSITSDSSNDMMIHLDKCGNDLMLFEYYCGLILEM